ncbi:MAG: leucine-rich repeat protein, partial [Oscillospiraceae bacterium]|nr:leucine-rich repeat protein [Oscillospiraceae bacterium]
MEQKIRKPVAWLLTLAMLFTMLPSFTFTALAADNLCAHHAEHTAECGYEEGVSDCAYHCHVCHVQELIDALPGEVTAENAEAVAAQLTAIDSEKASLSEEELAQVDFAKYTAAAEALGSVYAAVPAEDATVTDTTADTTYPYAVVDTAAGTVTIDGTLGGKTEANEDDVAALVDAIKGYVDSGITTITVTGSNPATYSTDYSTTTAIGEAIYRLSGSGTYDADNLYNGKIDLILSDVTEIVDYDFFKVYALNSITLPNVTKLGYRAFNNCQYLQKITFGSVVTEGTPKVEDFQYVGEAVGGCDLVLNHGQADAAAEYQPNASDWRWWADTQWKSITLDHFGGVATCTAKAVCNYCSAGYGEVDPDNHTGTLGTYAPTADGSQHAATWNCCNTVETADHTAEPTYALNTDDSTKHDVTYSCCGATHSEAHTINSATGKCVCGLDMAKASLTSGETVTYYATLAEAITAAQSATGSTVKLLDSVTISSDIVIEAGQFTIDLNGKTLTAEQTVSFALQIRDDANVTVTSSASDGKIEAEGDYCVLASNGGTAKVTNVALHLYSDSDAAGATNANSVLTLENVTITSGRGGVYAGHGGKVEILGNSSVKGDLVDIGCDLTSTLTVGTSVTFPDGLTAENHTDYKPLKDMLADGMAYWTGENQMVQPDANTREITGTVTVREACTHSDASK